MEDFRGFVQRLEKEGELLRVRREVDARYISALVAKSDKALLFEKVEGFAFPVVSGVLNTRKRLAMALNAPEKEIAHRFQEGIDRPIPPKTVKDAPGTGGGPYRG